MYTKEVFYNSEDGFYTTEHRLFGICLYRKAVHRNAINVYH